jgi:putative ABC transport system permease protein
MTSYFGLAIENLRHRKKRAYLTIIGVFIGIMAVVALVSLGQGLEAGVDEQFSKLGVDKLFIMPASGGFGTVGGTASAPIGDDDIDRIRSVPGVVEAAGTKYRTAQVEWRDTTVFPIIYDLPSDSRERALIVETFAVELQEGRLLENGDRTRAVIGPRFTDRTKYEDPLVIGRTIRINGVAVEIVGILKQSGDPTVDEGIFIPTSAYDDAFPSGIGEADYIVARIDRAEDPVLMEARIEESLRNLRDVEEGEEDFSVQTTEDLRESFDAILGIIQVVLTGIALISLLVGAVGITNTMYTAVLERTKEIGIMKAVGARNEDILKIFLIESGLLGLLGGFVGVVLGLGISYLASIIAAQALGSAIIKFVAPWWLIVGSLLFGFVIGALAGYLPARQAASMKPVDSLRYE